MDKMTSTNGDSSIKSRTRECKEREAKGSSSSINSQRSSSGKVERDRETDREPSRNSRAASAAAAAATTKNSPEKSNGSPDPVAAAAAAPSYLTPAASAGAVRGSPRKTRAETKVRPRRGGIDPAESSSAAKSKSNKDDGDEPEKASDSDESAVCEDVSVTVAGKKNAIRGKVWRVRNGDYVRYRCVDDGCEYRPGGKSLFFCFFFSNRDFIVARYLA